MTDHAHTWDVAAPDGPTSMAVCRGCPEVKEMPNSLAIDQTKGAHWTQGYRSINISRKRALAQEGYSDHGSS